MAHHPLLLIIGLTALSLCVNGQFQFFHKPIRPLYFVHKPVNSQSPNTNQQINKTPINFNQPSNGPASQEDDEQNSSKFSPLGRADLGLSSSEEEDQNDSSNTSGENGPPNGPPRPPNGPPNGPPRRRNSTALPPNFDAAIRANRPPLEPRPRRPMFGDPAVMEDEDEEPDRSRYLWPFSTTVTVSKTKKGHGHGLGPPPHLSYHDYVEQMYNTAHGIHHHDHQFGPHHYDKYLTNEEILHSKGSRPSPNQRISSPPPTSSSWGLSLPSLKLRGGLLSRLLLSSKSQNTFPDHIERFPPPSTNLKRNRLRTEIGDRNTKASTKSQQQPTGGKKRVVNKEKKKEKVKKTIYSILMNTMDALDKDKDED